MSPGARLLVPLPLLLLAILAAPVLPPALADGPASPAPAGPIPTAPTLVEVTGESVNVRVGPRVDNRAVTTLSRGDVLLVVEDVPGWKGVRIPAGFPVAVSLDYVVPEGPSSVRVMARNLNLRVCPPEAGEPAPGIFRDHPALGELLTLIDIEDPEPEDAEAPEGDGTERPFGHRWAWVVAPEEIRVYVSDRFLRPIARDADGLARLAAARDKRRVEAEQLAEARRLVEARASAMRLMEVVGNVQRSLHDLRENAASNDKAPVVALATRLDKALETESKAMPSVLRLAKALDDDLDREIALRVARHDAALARELGREPTAIPPLAPKADDATFKGIIRYEPTPGWKEPGVYFLWIDGRPLYVLRPGGVVDTSGEAVLREATDAREHDVEGALLGKRLFGLPVLEVRRIH